MELTNFFHCAFSWGGREKALAEKGVQEGSTAGAQ